MKRLPPLPPHPGPQLLPFPCRGTHTHDIEFLDILGTGAHARAFKVSIGGQIRVLKLFLFVGTEAYWPVAFNDDYQIDDERVEYELHPFHCECRAYGRLKEEDREDVAVKCHGYILLDDRYESLIEDQFEIPMDSWGRAEGDQRPLRGIVKDFRPGSVPFRPQHAAKMVRDMKTMHGLGIYIKDVRPPNYVEGLLVDFSQARVQPHMMLDKKEPFDFYLPEWVEDEPTEDYQRLDEMFDNWNKDNAAATGQWIWDRVLPSNDYVNRLRHKPRDNKIISPPCDYDWKQAKRGRERRVRKARSRKKKVRRG